MIKITATIVTESSDSARQFAELNREATKAKAAGNWDAAIALLRKAKAIRGALYDDVRLAKFLQQAGRFDEAITEIQWLIDHANAWAEETLSNHPRSMRRQQQAGHMSRIHREAALICKREKMENLRRQHEAEHLRWRDIFEKLEPVVEAERQRRKDEFARAQASGPEAMKAYLKKWRPDQVS